MKENVEEHDHFYKTNFEPVINFRVLSIALRHVSSFSFSAVSCIDISFVLNLDF
jgi:hypothetical protein